MGKYCAKKQRKKLPLSVYLVFLLTVTFLFSGVTFSKYYTDASASDSARVAKFDVRVSQSNAEMNLNTQNADTRQGEYIIKVTNNSEVKIQYTIQISNLPENVVVSLKNDTTAWNATRELGIGEEVSHTLIFNAEGVEENLTAEMIVEVLAEQVN